MTGEKLSRIRKCHTCRHRWTQHADVSRWPLCDVDNSDLSDVRMEAGDPSCPLGYWKNLAPETLPTEQEQYARRVSGQVGGPVGESVRVTLENQPENIVKGKLEDLVSMGHLLPDAAAELENRILGT